MAVCWAVLILRGDNSWRCVAWVPPRTEGPCGFDSRVSTFLAWVSHQLGNRFPSFWTPTEDISRAKGLRRQVQRPWICMWPALRRLFRDGPEALGHGGRGVVGAGSRRPPQRLAGRRNLVRERRYRGGGTGCAWGIGRGAESRVTDVCGQWVVVGGLWAVGGRLWTVGCGR